jgi:hypothetical protein
MPQKLASLQSQLSALCWRRWLLRVVYGSLAVAIALGLALAAAFALDWNFRYNRSERGALLVVVGALALWTLIKYVWPALVSRESVIDMALKVERRQQIDSDLVAALQFESAAAATWGSMQLEGAVVERVAQFGRQLPIGKGLSGTSLWGRLVPLVLVAAGWAVAVTQVPDHVTAFLDRFLLGSAHYPTRTRITRIVVNGVEAYPAVAAGGTVKIPFGTNLQFAVEAAGEIPVSGEVRLQAEEGTATINVELTPVEEPAADVTSSNRKFSGELARTPENLTYQVFLGDAWSEPAKIHVILPPVITMELDYTPPRYAAKARLARPATGSRQISVMEGSQVALSVRCANKPLEKVEMIIDDARFSLVPKDDEKRIWNLPAGTPLDQVITALTFDVEAVDVDGLSPDQPLRGQIYIQADRPPRVAGAVVTEKVLPGARPSIVWGAADDNGLAEIRLIKQVTRASGEIAESTEIVQRIDADKQPVPTLRGRHVVNLKPLGLAKGDEVRVTLEAVDYRGNRPGAVANSEAIVFTVTDESGILAGLVEADEKSARQLDQIIQRQLGIGEAR